MSSQQKKRALSASGSGSTGQSSRFDVEQFRMGLGVELEHGRRDPATNMSDDDEITTGRSPGRT